MSHEEAFPELSAVALDAVPPEVASAVRAHAAACPECGPELAAMEQTVAILGELAPSAQINRGRSAGIRSRLLVRGRAERQSDPHRFRDRRTLREVSRVSPDRGTGSPRWTTSGNGDTKKVTPAQTARVPLEAVPATLGQLVCDRSNPRTCDYRRAALPRIPIAIA